MAPPGRLGWTRFITITSQTALIGPGPAWLVSNKDKRRHRGTPSVSLIESSLIGDVSDCLVVLNVKSCFHLLHNLLPRRVTKPLSSLLKIIGAAMAACCSDSSGRVRQREQAVFWGCGSLFAFTNSKKKNNTTKMFRAGVHFFYIHSFTFIFCQRKPLAVTTQQTHIFRMYISFGFIFFFSATGEV